MAVQETTSAVKAVMKLDDGTTATGSKKWVNVSLGTLSKDGWDATKAWAIANAFDNGVGSKVLGYVLKTTETEVVDD